MLKTGRERRKETRLSQVSGLGSWEVSGVRVRDPEEKTLPLSLCPPPHPRPRTPWGVWRETVRISAEWSVSENQVRPVS